MIHCEDMKVSITGKASDVQVEVAMILVSLQKEAHDLYEWAIKIADLVDKGELPDGIANSYYGGRR